MTNKTTIPSLQDIHRKRQQPDFTGRRQRRWGVTAVERRDCAESGVGEIR